jgi:hypothetical protein
MMGDLDLLSQGHSLVVYILKTIWPTELIFCMGDQVRKVFKTIMMGVLDLISQGHSLAGYILRTIWPTEFIFCREDQVRKVFKVHHDGWPWPNFSRSCFSRLYLRNRLTYRVHILHGGPV